MVRRFSLLLSVLAMIIMVAACAPVAPEAPPPAMPTAVPGQVTVLNPMSRPVPMAGGNGAAFMTIQNGTDATVRLVAAEAEVADVVELHETVQEGDIMRMIPQPEGWEIEPGGTLQLRPGGKHVMMIGVPEPPAVGDTFALTLRFEDGSAIELTVPVMDMTAVMESMGGEVPAGMMQQMQQQMQGGAESTPAAP